MVVGGATAALAGACGTWLQTGAESRNSFALVTTARSLGVVTGSAASFVATWYLLPCLVGCIWLAAGAERDRLAAVAGILTAALAGIGALVAFRSPFATGFGPQITAVGAGITVLGIALTFLDTSWRKV